MKALSNGKPRFLRIGPSVSDEVKSKAGVIEFLMACHSGRFGFHHQRRDQVSDRLKESEMNDSQRTS